MTEDRLALFADALHRCLAAAIFSATSAVIISSTSGGYSFSHTVIPGFPAIEVIDRISQILRFQSPESQSHASRFVDDHRSTHPRVADLGVIGGAIPGAIPRLFLAHAPLPPRLPHPLTRRTYWLAKLRRNKRRDTLTRQKLRLGYRVLTVWECQTRDLPCLRSRLSQFLGTTK